MHVHTHLITRYKQQIQNPKPKTQNPITGTASTGFQIPQIMPDFSEFLILALNTYAERIMKLLTSINFSFDSVILLDIEETNISLVSK